MFIRLTGIAVYRVFVKNTTMKKNRAAAALLTAILVLVVPSFMRGQVANLTNTENTLKGFFKKKKTAKPDTTATAAGTTTGSTTAGADATTGPATLTTYSNYDFVPGEQVVFEDHFTDDQDGEFPAHWRLTSGQGVVNKIGNDPAFCLTEGNYVRVAPRMKTEKNYLPENFTIEFDFYAAQGAY